ncbi:polysaccharide pyruvyl transferase family protein [Kosmotoga pacifica]|uniref:Polysaccharide pyruvyl transferase domain-containing protein n=1 Tax=Kosmotoga pacifica TaxID=1330330 RepID=A0A0G2Z5W9_9BACT|nr:polysaccharide pyruvyl transferase family protein [Kosmotoga pacifica]AKI97005.1 hypothetical protein IX53_03280 [Kosmotoga pacifica]
MNSYGIVLVGYYGYRNFGDDLLLFSTLRLLKEVGYTGNIFIPSPARLKTFLNENSYDLNIKVIPRYNPISLKKVLRNSSLTIFGGGNLLQDETSVRSFLYYYYIARRTLKNGNKLLFLSQGFGPIRNPSNSQRLSLILSDYNTFGVLRDAVSFRFARKYSDRFYSGTDYGPYCLGTPKKLPSKDKNLALMIPRGLEMSEQIIEALKNRGYRKLCVMPFQNHCEVELVKRIERLALSKGLELVRAPENKNGIVEIFQKAGLVITERLHGAILAAWQATPFVWRSGRKTNRFFSSFGKLPLKFNENIESLKSALRCSEYFDYKSLSEKYTQELNQTIQLSKETLKKLLKEWR